MSNIVKIRKPKGCKFRKNRVDEKGEGGNGNGAYNRKLKKKRSKKRNRKKGEIVVLLDGTRYEIQENKSWRKIDGDNG